MPIELRPTLHRRQFLSQSGAMLGGLAIGSAMTAVGLAEAVTDEPKSLALISDIHIAENLADVNFGQNMADNLRSVVVDILNLNQRPVSAFITGDLALKDGQRGDYRQLLTLLNPLREAGLPVHLGLGNHDDRDKFQAILKDPLQLHEVQDSKYLTDLTLDFGTALAPAPLRLILLDSLNKVNITPGLLGTDQLLWLQDRLDDPKQSTVPTVVLLHHDPSNSTNALIDSDALLRMLSPRSQVKALVYGHTHVPSVRQQKDGLWHVNLPAVAFVFNKDQPLGWVQCWPNASGAKLELRAFGGDKTLDRKVFELAWR